MATGLKKPARPDDLEALVHHRGGVDGDALAHHPGGVLQRLRRRDVLELAERCRAEGAARGGQPYLLHLAWPSAAQALVDRVVLGVDGQQGDVALARGGEDELAGGDQTFLIGEADSRAGADGGIGGFEAGDTDDRRDDEVGLGQSGDVDSARRAEDDFGAVWPISRRRWLRAAAGALCS